MVVAESNPHHTLSINTDHKVFLWCHLELKCFHERQRAICILSRLIPEVSIKTCRYRIRRHLQHMVMKVVHELKSKGKRHGEKTCGEKEFSSKKVE